VAAAQFSALQVKFKCPEANANWRRVLHGTSGEISEKRRVFAKSLLPR
jgi:hypothetical protein